MEWFKGKKTYILVILGVAGVLIQFLAGDLSLMEFFGSEYLVQLIELLGIGTLRAGVSKIS
jgi:hypothetical protein